MAKQPLIGILSPGMPGPSPNMDAFIEGLRAHGYVDGETARIETRFAQQSYLLLDEAAHELAALKPDVIFGGNSHEALAIVILSSDIPVVTGASTDPVHVRLVRSLERPGWNATGCYTTSEAYVRRKLEAMRQVAPNARRIGLVYDGLDPERPFEVRLLRKEAKAMGIELVERPVRTIFDYAGSFSEAQNEGAEAVILLGGLSTILGKSAIVEAAKAVKVPLMVPMRYWLPEVGDVCVGVSTPDLYRRAATFVHRVLQGENPANMAMETTDQFDVALKQR